MKILARQSLALMEVETVSASVLRRDFRFVSGRRVMMLPRQVSSQRISDLIRAGQCPSKRTAVAAGTRETVATYSR